MCARPSWYIWSCSRVPCRCDLAVTVATQAQDGVRGPAPSAPPGRGRAEEGPAHCPSSPPTKPTSHAANKSPPRSHGQDCEQGAVVMAAVQRSEAGPAGLSVGQWMSLELHQDASMRGRQGSLTSSHLSAEHGSQAVVRVVVGG